MVNLSLIPILSVWPLGLVLVKAKYVCYTHASLHIKTIQNVQSKCQSIYPFTQNNVIVNTSAATNNGECFLTKLLDMINDIISTIQSLPS